MIIPLAALVGLLLPALLGGDLRRLGHVRLRGIAVALVAFGGQLLAVSVLDGPVAVLAAVHVASYLLVGYAVWANRRLPGLPALAAGALSNGLTIALNGGTLPAREGALRAAGLAQDAGFTNSGVLEHPRLAFLGDVFAIPADWPLSNVFSVGDVLIVAGATWASLRICGTRWTPAWRLPRRHAAVVGPPVAAGPSVPRQRDRSALRAARRAVGRADV